MAAIKIERSLTRIKDGTALVCRYMFLTVKGRQDIKTRWSN